MAATAKLDTPQNLRGLRRGMVMSMRELSERSGVSKSTICDLEAGVVVQPRPITIRKLAEAFEIDPRQLVRILDK